MASRVPSKTTPGLPTVALIRRTSAAVWFKPPSTWITQVILNAKVNPLLSHSPPLLVTHCTLCLSCRHIHPSDEGRSVLLIIHPRLSTCRHLLIAGRRSFLYSNSGSCKLTYFRLTVEHRLRSSNGDMWHLYNSRAEKHDRQLAEHWKGQLDTILNFVRSESSSVTGNFLI